MVEARELLNLMKMNGQQITFLFQSSPNRLIFSYPGGARDIDIEIVSGVGYAILRDLIASISPQASVKLRRAGRRVEISGGNLTL